MPQFQLCDLVVSSRQPVSAQLYQSLNCTRVEIIGFTGELINQYIKEHCDVKNESELKKYLECNLILKSICYHPFFLNNLVFLFENSKLQSNETAVIETLTCFMIKWYLKEGNSYNLSIDKLSAKQNLVLTQISHLAYLVCQSGKMTFKMEEFSESLHRIFGLNGIGFLKCFVSNYNNDLFTFIHHSFQQFLCAFYLTTLPYAKQKKFRNGGITI